MPFQWDPDKADMNQDAEFPFDRARRVTPEEHQRFKAMVERQIQTVELTAIVSPDGTTTLQLPPEITPGEHPMTLLIQTEQSIAQ
jgi:hypothetical protein